MRIFIIDTGAVNVDNDDDANALVAQGARELTATEISAAGMTGYEHLVAPSNTTITADGKVVFTPPAPPASELLFASLRAERDRRVAASDYLMMPDYPLTDDSRVAVQTYRQELRDLPAMQGAPWDGGGPETPWPHKPDVLNTANKAEVRSTYLPPTTV